MGWLVFETFVLMLGFVAIGIAIGIALRGLADLRQSRPSMAGARFAPIGPSVGEPAHGPARHDPVPQVAPISPDPEIVVVEPEPPAVSATEPQVANDGGGIIDPDKAAAADQVGVRPAALSRPRDQRPDDLKIIKGIGPQNESRLNALGIFHLDQIADWSAEEARWIGSYLAFPGRIEREDWIGQARKLTGRAPQA